jgi:glycine betaine/proline transport system substrate-binding protein
MLLKIKKVSLTFSAIALIGLMLAGCGSTAAPKTNEASVQPATNEPAKTAQPEDKKVVLGYVNWDEDVAVTHLWKNLLEKKGYSVDLRQLDIGPLYTALNQGGVDVHFDVWMPLTNKNYMDKFSANFVTLGKWYKAETKMGYVVPKYMDKINSIEDLKAHAAEFKGKAIGVEPGSETSLFAKKALEGYGIDNIKLTDSSTPAMLSALAQAYGEKKPILVTLWSPHWAFGKYDLKYLEDPKGVMGQPGWIQTEANKKWAESHPTAAKWIGNMTLTDPQLAQLEIEINTAKDSDPNVGVQKWLEKNQSLADSWLN